MVVVHSNKRGFTLIELLVSLVILMVGLLGLLQAINMALQYNMKSQLDHIGALIADQQMAQELSKPFANVSTTYTTAGTVYQPPPVTRQVNLATINYTVQRKGTVVSANTTGVNIQVSWIYRGNTYSHSIYAMVSNYNH
jgi:type IV pilus assembly protein PilV